MKKIKQFRLLLPVLAMSVAICASAFTKAPNKFATVTSYFANESHATGVTPPVTIPSSYTVVTSIVNALTPPPGESKYADYNSLHCATPTTIVCSEEFQINTITKAATLVSSALGTWAS